MVLGIDLRQSRVLVLVLSIDLQRSRVLVLVLGIDLGPLEVLVLVLTFAKLVLPTSGTYIIYIAKKVLEFNISILTVISAVPGFVFVRTNILSFNYM